VAAAGAGGTYYASRSALAAQGGYVRRNFGYYNCFRPVWYRRYPGAWFAAGWLAGTAWTGATWSDVSGYCEYPAEPVYYDYGSSVVSQGDVMYVNGDPVGTTVEYEQQAVQIADAGLPPPDAAAAPPPPQGDDWKPLGVFAMVQPDQSTSTNIFQLALNKEGLLRGNYYNALTDTTEPIYGSVDAKTQRAAWTVADKKIPVYEVGIANLTLDQTTMLVHFGEGRSEQFSLVRIEAPEDAPAEASSTR
jgi:hypothetical protein